MDEDNIFPDDFEDYEDIDSEDLEDEVIGYKSAPKFDYKAGEFIIDGHGSIVTADGVTAWKQWCENVIATQRYNHDSYTDDIGIDWNEIFNTEDAEATEKMIETEIAEALECDPYGRTEYVQNVEFEWINTDELWVKVDVVGMDNEMITIEKTITR